MYKAVEHFKDLQDNRHEYHPGDKYPRDGLNVSRERLAALSTAGNGMGRPLIKESAPERKPTAAVQEPAEIPKEEIKPQRQKKGRRKEC